MLVPENQGPWCTNSDLTKQNSLAIIGGTLHKVLIHRSKAKISPSAGRRISKHTPYFICGMRELVDASGDGLYTLTC